MQKTCSNPKFLLIMLLLCSLSGCGSKYGDQITKVDRYPECYRPIEELRKSEYAVEKSTALGVFLGAVGGAVAGYAATRDGKGALIGAAAGAVVGGVAGYYFGDSQKIANDNQRRDKYLEVMRNYNGKMDAESVTASAAMECYSRAFQSAVLDYRSKRISKEEFDRRYTEIASGMQEVGTVLDRAIAEGHEMQDGYMQLFTQEAQKSGLSQQDSQNILSAASAQAAKKTAQGNTGASSRASTPGMNQIGDMATQVAQLDMKLAGQEANRKRIAELSKVMERERANIML